MASHNMQTLLTLVAAAIGIWLFRSIVHKAVTLRNAFKALGYVTDSFILLHGRSFLHTCLETPLVARSSGFIHSARQLRSSQGFSRSKVLLETTMQTTMVRFAVDL